MSLAVAHLWRVLRLADFGLWFTLAPFLLGDVVHDGGDVLAAAAPCFVLCELKGGLEIVLMMVGLGDVG